MMAAVAMNRKENSTVTHSCVEPYRNPEFKFTLDQHFTYTIQETPLNIFTDLEAGDVLFLDTSHVMQPFGDTIYEFVFLLPQLKSGVVVHIHDIFLPYDYPETWMFNQERPYTEQWMVALLLQGKNPDWEIIFPNWKIGVELHLFEGFDGSVNGDSFWMKKK